MTRKSAEPATYRVQVLERAVDILQVLSEDSRELAAGEVAERLSLHKSTIHRLLAVLDHHRLIRKNAETGKYALGLRLFEFGTRAVRGLQLRDQAQPHLEQLARETGETAHICVYDNGEMVSLAYAEGPRSLRMPATVGGRTPAYCSAVGKAMLAFLPDAAVDEVMSRSVRACTEKTLVTRAALQADLRQIRIRGYAVDNEEIEKGSALRRRAGVELLRRGRRSDQCRRAGVPHHAQPGPDRRPRGDRGDHAASRRSLAIVRTNTCNRQPGSEARALRRLI